LKDCLVGLGGLEPPTFPILSGRSSQRFDVDLALRSLDFPLALGGVAPGREHFRVEQFPRSAVLDGGGSIVIVIEDAFGQILRMTDIKSARRFAL
jgi:hypothetical protein